MRAGDFILRNYTLVVVERFMKKCFFEMKSYGRLRTKIRVYDPFFIIIQTGTDLTGLGCSVNYRKQVLT